MKAGAWWAVGAYVALSLAAWALGPGSTEGAAAWVFGPAAALGQLVTLCSRLHVYGSLGEALAGEAGLWLVLDAFTWLLGLVLARRAGASWGGAGRFLFFLAILAAYWLLIAWLNTALLP